MGLTGRTPLMRCGKRYGKSRALVCRRLAGHTGAHALRLTAWELRRVYGLARADALR